MSKSEFNYVNQAGQTLRATGEIAPAPPKDRGEIQILLDDCAELLDMVSHELEALQDDVELISTRVELAQACRQRDPKTLLGKAMYSQIQKLESMLSHVQSIRNGLQL